AYDSSAHDSVTLGGTGATSAVALHNVANGTLSASSLDAVNGSQLYETNTNVSNLAGNVTNLAGDVTTINGQITTMQGQLADAVLYDTSAHDSVTLGGSGATSAVALHNVANGTLSASSLDAVNGSQLYETNTNVSNLAGDVTTINGQITNMQGQLADAVLYDTSAHDSVTLGGSGATSAVALHNVANGVLSASSLDAVNGSQLYETNTNVSNLAGDVTTINGQITNMQGQLADAVLYDSSAHDSVTLGGTGATSAVALHNVANGLVNASSFDAVNGSQLYTLASSTASSLGGGSTVNSDGSISNPTYNIGGNAYNNAGDAFTALNGDITNINGQLADAVAYDSSAHDSVTLGGSGATSAVALHNVANGVLSASSYDAVNGSQLYETNTNVSNLAGDVTTINGQITNMQGQLADAVLYDSSAHDSVTLGGTGATSAVALHNVANGLVNASSFDAVNGSQLYTLASSTASSLGGGSTVNSDGSISNPTYNIGGNAYNNAGDAFTALNGDITNINGQLADAVLYDTSAHDSVTLGGSGATSAVALHNVANGTLSASSYDAVNGSQLYATNQSISNLSGDITNINGQLQDAVMYDSSAHDSVTLGGTSATSAVALHNVAAGDVSASSFDAVNGSQLYNTASSTAGALGGGSTVNPDGSISNPTYVLNGGTFNNVGSALTNVDGRVTNVINDITNGTIGLVQQDPTTRNITVAKNTDGTIVDFTGTAGTRVLTGVSNGAVNASSVDAVNGSQLYATNQSISNLSGDITNINGQLQDAVMYDSSAHDSVTLGGTGATSAVALHNVAAGDVSASSFDAVNGSQLYNTASSTASALGGGSTVNPDGSISNPTYVLNGGTFNNVGSALTNVDGRVTNVINDINNGTIGLVRQATPMSTVTVAKDTGGTTVDFTGTAGTRVLTGVSNGVLSATSVDAVNGSQLYATNQSITSLQGSISSLSGDITNINGKLADAVMYDSSAHDSVTLGGAGSTSSVALHNVAAGDVSASSTDAVNGSQLYSLMQDVNNIASNASDPMFTANGDRNTEAASASGTHATAAGANANASGAQATAMGANSVASGNQSTALGAGSTASANNAVALGAGSVADRDNTVSVGSAGNERQITNVAAGTAGTDAVNVNQLNDAVNNATGNAVQQATQQSNAYTNQQISVVRKQMNSLGAAAMAASSLIPNARAEGNFQMAAAAGTYGGETALALGANWYVSDRLLLNAHVSKSTGGGSVGASVGATFGF
uniref:YadA family autotransporter adhesin n=2 Tax=unclassified Paraburkholderia TaxID=2615204 RepID=UPI002AB69A55